MDVAPKISPKQFSEALRGEVEMFLESVMLAVNEAADGEWISGSEEQVRELCAVFRQRVFQEAVQQRIDAAEAAFPPPQETMIDPVTKQVVVKRLANKGRQPTHVLSVNGRIVLKRRWWHSPVAGSTVPADTLIDRQGQTVTGGVIEMASRLNNDGTSFDSAADNLLRTAQIKMSGEQLRQRVIAAGQSVLAAQRSAVVPTAFQATDCLADPTDSSSPTRIYTGVDGVMVPAVTEAEKLKRREAIKRKRQRSGKKCRPLPPRRKGTDEKFKEFKVVTFYDETGEHWHEVLTRGRWHTVGPLVRREARRLNFAAADEKIANVDGATRIRNQLEAKPHELPLDGLGLDFYHLAENVHKSRRIVSNSRWWVNQVVSSSNLVGFGFDAAFCYK